MDWIQDRTTGLFYGAAFLHMASLAAAKRLVNREGLKMGKRKLRVNFAPPAEPPEGELERPPVTKSRNENRFRELYGPWRVSHMAHRRETWTSWQGHTIYQCSCPDGSVGPGLSVLGALLGSGPPTVLQVGGPRQRAVVCTGGS